MVSVQGLLQQAAQLGSLAYGSRMYNMLGFIQHDAEQIQTKHPSSDCQVRYSTHVTSLQAFTMLDASKSKSRRHYKDPERSKVNTKRRPVTCWRACRRSMLHEANVAPTAPPTPPLLKTSCLAPQPSTHKPVAILQACQCAKSATLSPPSVGPASTTCVSACVELVPLSEYPQALSEGQGRGSSGGIATNGRRVF